MVAIYDKAKLLAGDDEKESLYERAQKLAAGGGIATVEEPVASNLSPASPYIESFKSLASGEITLSDVGREVPQATVETIKAFSNIFVPAIKNFFETTGSIIGEGLAYAVDSNVRKQYKAGNLNVLPTITATTQADVARSTIAAGIETAVYRSFPDIAKRKLLARGGLGAIQGLGFAVSEGLADEKSPSEIIEQLPAYGIGGTVIGVISPYLTPLLKAEMKRIPKEVTNLFKGIRREIVQKGKESPGTRKLAVQGTGGTSEVPIQIRRDLLRPPEELLALPKPSGTTQGVGFTMSNKADKVKVQIGKAQNAYRVAIQAYNKNPSPKTLSEVKKAQNNLENMVDLPSEQSVQQPLSERLKPSVVNNIGETRTTKVPGEQLPVGEGKLKISRLEGRVKSTLNKVRPDELDEVATYRRMNQEDQIRKATSFVTKNPDEALAVVKGEREAPQGLLNNSIALALEKRAEIAGDAQLALRLASLRSTRMGQEIGILVKAEPDNPVSAIRDIIEARSQRASRNLKKDTTIKKETAKARDSASKALKGAELKIAEAESVLDKITC